MGDPDSLLLSGGLVFGGYLNDPVGIDVKSYLNLGGSPGCRCNTGQFKPPQGFAVGCHFPFTLQHVNRHRRLIVCGGAKDLTLLGRDGGVFFNQFGSVTPPRVSMPRDSGVTSSSRTSSTSPFKIAPWIAAPMATTSSGLTPLLGSLAENLFYPLLNRRHADHAADQDYFVDVAAGKAGILHERCGRESAACRADHDQIFQLGPGTLDPQMFGTPGFSRDTRHITLFP